MAPQDGRPPSKLGAPTYTRLASPVASGAGTIIGCVPTISRFYGVTIQMFFKEHGVPHFHARYAGQVAVFGVESLDRIRGELMRNWEQARAGKSLAPIEPLA